MINPTATACMDTSAPIPNSEHAIGISKRDPPATPDAPQAPKVEIRHNASVTGSGTEIPIVWHTARVMTVIVTAAPSILIVEPNGMLIEKKSLSRPNRSHNCILTGMFAAELLEKNAVMPLSLRHVNTNGYGFLRVATAEMIGSVTKATNAMQPTKSAISWPYCANIPSPLSETEVNTNP